MKISGAPRRYHHQIQPISNIVANIFVNLYAIIQFSNPIICSRIFLRVGCFSRTALGDFLFGGNFKEPPLSWGFIFAEGILHFGEGGFRHIVELWFLFFNINKFTPKFSFFSHTERTREQFRFDCKKSTYSQLQEYLQKGRK